MSPKILKLKLITSIRVKSCSKTRVISIVLLFSFGSNFLYILKKTVSRRAKVPYAAD